MSYLDIFNARNKAYGNNVRESRINAQTSKILDQFYNSPSYFQVDVFLPSTPLSSTPLDVWVTDDSKEQELKNIYPHPDYDIGYGDIIHWQGYRWLVYMRDLMSEVYSRGRMRRCYSSLKWLDASGIVREAYFSLPNSNSSNFGIEDGRVLILPDERRTIQIQKNVFTLQLKREDRFIFDNRAWKIIGFNGLKDGIMDITLQETQINTGVDNVELRICNYYNNIHTYQVVIDNGDYIEANVGESVQINTTVLDNGKVSDKAVRYVSSDETIATVDNMGLVETLTEGTCTILAILVDDETVFDFIELSVQPVVVDVYTINITGADVVKVASSQTYTGTVYKNGVQDDTKSVVWALFADNGVSTTDLASITSSTGGQCIIKGLKYVTPISNSFVKLKAIMSGDSSVYTEKRIQIKSLV